MPVTAGTNQTDINQRLQYEKGGLGRKYWDIRDSHAIKWLQGPKVLDVGCGEGITLGKIIRLHPDWKVEGIDVDPVNVTICREFDLPAKRGSVYELPYENNFFDSCLLMEVIEHLEYPEKALNEISRVTKQNGKIIIVFPIDWAMFAARIICLRFQEATFDPGHLRQWNNRYLVMMLKTTGFELFKAISLPLPSPLALHKLVVAQKA
ncbi:MAG: class I SAM-dependent methyltransferase [Kiritimatiellae bacterium]|nr:class I SAM-dependent methyltransferase [Kiritimatiellia bacterium]MDD5522839.1 class I SAM-dependent methyltransferase [Kiritimatiellia bacterium]